MGRNELLFWQVNQKREIKSMRRILFSFYREISLLLFKFQGVELKKNAYISRKDFRKIGGANLY